jgi:hypothetical protein
VDFSGAGGSGPHTNGTAPDLRGQPAAPGLTWNAQIPRPLSDEQVQEWTARRDRARTVRQQHEPRWKRNLERYAPPPSSDTATSYDINPQIDFRLVETKKANLFYDVPEVRLEPTDLRLPPIPGPPGPDGLPTQVTAEQVTVLRERVLNHKLSADGADVKRAYHEGLVDTLAASGFLCHKIGYRNVTMTVETTQPGMLGQPPTPMSIPVPIFEECFWSAFPSDELLIPDDFTGSDYDQAPWLAHDYTVPLTPATRREFKLPEDFTGAVADDGAVYTHDRSHESTVTRIRVTEVWYRAAQFDADVVHPELYRKVVIVDGLETAEGQDSPYQSIDARGRLTDDSMVGCPIHVGTIRTVPKSAYVPSDLTVIGQLREELIRFRTQQVRERDARIPKTVVDEGAFTPDQLLKLEKGDIGAIIKVIEGKLGGGIGNIMAPVVTGTSPRENVVTQDLIERDIERAIAIGSNQSGVITKGKRTATELRLVQGNADARTEAERGAVRRHFVKGVRKFDSILQRYLTLEAVQKILGPAAGQLWDAWKFLPGKYAYQVRPDSGVHVDAVQDLAQKIDLWNMIGNHPNINAIELLKPLVKAAGFDSDKVVNPKGREKAPEPPKLNASFAATDLLVPPLGRLFLDLLAQSGYQISAQAIQMLAEAHQALGQMAPQATGSTPGVLELGAGGTSAHEPMNKHQRERTGGVNGVGIQ